MIHAILAAEECGKTDRVGAKLFKVNQSAVCRICNRYNETKAIYQEPTQGRPRKTTEDKLQQNLRLPRRFLKFWCNTFDRLNLGAILLTIK